MKFPKFSSYNTADIKSTSFVGPETFWHGKASLSFLNWLSWYEIWLFPGAAATDSVFLGHCVAGLVAHNVSKDNSSSIFNPAMMLGFNSHYWPECRGFKLIVPLNAFMAIWCTKAGSEGLRVKEPGNTNPLTHSHIPEDLSPTLNSFAYLPMTYSRIRFHPITNATNSPTQT